MEILVKALDALWQVALVALILGAGLPALFALGVRALNAGRAPVAVTVTESGSGSSTGARAGSGRPSTLGRLAAGICFAVSIAAVLFGIVVIVWGKQLFGA